MNALFAKEYNFALLDQQPAGRAIISNKVIVIAAAILFVGLLIVAFFPRGASDSSSAKLRSLPLKSNVSSFSMVKVKEVLGSNCEKELKALQSDLQSTADETRVDPLLLMAIMQVESNCSAEAHSNRGAVGLMQVIPSTALSMGISDVAPPSQNIQAAAKYLKFLKSSVGNDLGLMLAAYHAGPTALKLHGGIPPYKSTRDYVAKVQILYDRLRGQTVANSAISS